MNNHSREQVELALFNLLSADQAFIGTSDGAGTISGIEPAQYQGLYYGEVITGAVVPDNTRITRLPSPGVIVLSNAVPAGAVFLNGQIFKRKERRIVEPSNIPPDQRPSICVFPHVSAETHKSFGPGIPPEITLNMLAIIYTDAKVATESSGIAPISLLNPIVDALVNIKLAPDLMTLRQTLGEDAAGPFCHHAYVAGDVIKNGGDLDGLGIAIIPVKILVPW
jgi:hypothetical protein